MRAAVGPKLQPSLHVASAPPISLDDVLAARAATLERLHRTPTFSSAALSQATGANVFLKAELFQRTGSFKPRGVLNILRSLSPEEKARGVIAISAGNHAQAVAYCAALERIDALVVMWKGASAAKIAATRAYGAEVDLDATTPAQGFERLAELRERTGRTLVHPFDDPRGLAGQGTLGVELLEDVPETDVVVVPIGGGGLIAGVATAVREVRPQARVVGIEPELSCAMHRALEAGEPVAVTPSSIADGLNAPFAGTNALAVCRARLVEIALVSDDEIAAGMRFLYERAKLACEPAGAAATAALLAGKVRVTQGETVVAIVSGGNVSAELASAILAER